MTDRCGCEVGDDCTKTTMCAVQAAVEDTREPLSDALDHIMRVCRNTDVQTKRLLWIEKRAECAINGSEDWREYDYPKVRKAAKENNGLRDRIKQLEAAIENALHSLHAQRTPSQKALEDALNPPTPKAGLARSPNQGIRAEVERSRSKQKPDEPEAKK